MYVAAGLHSIALLIALFIQTNDSPLAGAWLPFHLAGCGFLLAHNQYPKQARSYLWRACFLWMAAVCASAFVICPVRGAALQMWYITATPLLALCLQKQNIVIYIKCAFSIVFLFSFSLIVQHLIGIGYTYSYGDRLHPYAAWPLVDPNNAACVITFGLVFSFWEGMQRKKWLLTTLVFCAALVITGSKAGILACMVGCACVLSEYYKLPKRLWVAIVPITLGVMAYEVPTMLKASMIARLELWDGAAQLFYLHPLRGIGLGQFRYYYDTVRHETSTIGNFAHNDLMQFAIEMGIPVALAAVLLMIAIAKTPPYIAKYMLLAVFIESCVEFQFYLPCIDLLAGIALGALLVKQRA